MSDTLQTGIIPPGFARGPYQGDGLIGEITEAVHKHLLDGWDLDRPRPRIEEDLSFEPKDRQEVIYVYMYRIAQNEALKNSKAWRPAKISLFQGKNADRNNLIFERAPIYLQVYYVVAVHSRFRSDAERLLGWTLLRLWEASNLIYRPRKYTLPDGTLKDSAGSDWSLDNSGDKVIMEKVDLALCDDLPIGDAINFFTIHEAPFRPYLTFQAMCAMEGSLVTGPAAVVSTARMAEHRPSPPIDRPGGRMKHPPKKEGRTNPIGPPGFDHRPIEEDD